MPQGRPPTIEINSIIETIMMFKDEIICDKSTKSCVPKTHSVWKTMSENLVGKIKPSSLYSYVVNDRFSIKSLLFDVKNDVKNDSLNNFNDTTASTISEIDQSLQKNCELGFILAFSKNEFDDLIMETQRQTKDKKGKRTFRLVSILKPEKWTEIVSKKIYDEYRLPHGYHFKSSYLSRDKTSGGFVGHCKCGSKLTCELLPRREYEELVKIKCVVSAGSSDCGKRQCRNESRKRVVEILEKESTEMYRTKKAAKLMTEEDSYEPPHLYSADVLRTAKYQSQLKKYRDLDPIRAISQYKKTGGQTVIRDIGFDPFHVHFWSPHQIRIYNKLAKKNSFLCIDATGGIAKRIIHVDGNRSHHIFLYLAVLSCPSTNASACAMLSEHQDTVSITTWLMRWIQSGADYPKEVVCDSSKALLNACCIVFTGFKCIGSYAEACMSNKLPKTKIGIDVAHYLHNWATALSLEKKEVKKFYMFCIGQLILCRSKTDATKIIEALLLISSCETAGIGAPSLTKATDLMKSLITEVTIEVKEIVEESLLLNKDFEEEEQEEDEMVDETGNLKRWITSMQEKINSTLTNEFGDDINPRFSLTFKHRLLKQLPTIPLWSNICRDQFGFGRVPVSSSAVEIEFKTLKNNILRKEKRADVAVEEIVNYYNGKMKIINCAVNQNVVSHDADIVTPIDLNNNCSPELNRSIQDDVLSSSSSEILLDKFEQHTDEENKENTNQDQIMSSTINDSTQSQRVALQEVENWRGLGVVENCKKKSYYLTKTNQDLNDMILPKKPRKLPILKNGNLQSLSLVTVGLTKFSVINTCPLDSLFQIFLAAATDNENIMNFIKCNKNKNALYEMVFEVVEKKIQQTTYQKRLQIYLSYWGKISVVPNSIQTIDGACNVVSIANFLFKNCVSFEEKSTCQHGCPPRIKNLPSITISEKEIFSSMSQVIRDHINFQIKCINEHCNGLENNEIHKIGDITIIGVDMDRPTKLQSFSKSYVCPKTKEIYRILGIIQYIGAPVVRSSTNDLGHYVAIVRRHSNWVVYDDKKKKSYSVNETYCLTAELLIYSKL